MSWGLIGGAAVIGGALGYAGSEMMGDSAVGGVELPEFQEPEYYTDIQDLLKAFGTGAIEGDVPEFYEPLVETGSPEFQAYLTRTLGEAKGGALEAAARTNQRGGAVQESMAQTAGDITAKLTYQDFLRAMQGRQNMLGLGLNTVENVRDADLNYARQENQFNLGLTQLALGQAGAEDEWQAQKVGMITSGVMGGAKIGVGAAMGSSFGGGSYADPTGSYNVGYGQGYYPGGYQPDWGHSTLY